MSFLKKHPVLYGYRNGNRIKLGSPREVAEFIVQEGHHSDLIIETRDGQPFISTCGIYLNRIADMSYRAELMPYLLPLQKGYGSMEEYEKAVYGNMLI